ncbi:MAG TPA: V-type ATP synthase subunit F [Candidatus Lachnoclostridium avicola]|nr:V-type ATP synthase subunit F [Candidatus Lachnoclostridium avicola]
MKMYLISDNTDTYTGMRLAGVEGVVVHEKKELQEALDKVLADKEIGIVLLTEKFGREFPDVINQLKLEYRTPLFVEIPDRHGTGRKPNFITDYVNEAIGLKL